MNSEEFCRKFEQLQAVYTDIIEKTKQLKNRVQKSKNLNRQLANQDIRLFLTATAVSL